MPLASDLSNLATEGAVIAVQNQLPGIVVFTDDAQKIVVTWEAKGNAAGKDIVECPATFLRNPKFRETVLRKILTIEDAPEVLQAALAAQTAAWDQRQQASQDAEQTLTKMADAVVAHGVACIAPKGKELCGSYGLVMGKNATEHPPLCTEHQSLASQYIAVDSGRIVDGKPEIVWTRAKLVRS